MKKIALTALSTLLLFGVVGCGANYNADVKPAPEGNTVHFLGGYEQGGWDATGDNKMDATSVKGVSEASKDVANALANKNISWLYMKSGLELGTKDAGWTARCKKSDGKIYIANGSFTVKAGLADYDPDDEVYSISQWISDPHTAHVESLSPSTLFFPTWQEEADEDGFAWDQNPVCIGGAGVYTLVVAKYNETSAENVFGFGMALIKTADKTAAVDYQEEISFVPSQHTFGLIGSFEGSGWSTDVAMTGNDAKTEFTVTQALKKDDIFKIRVDGKWDYEYNFKSIKGGKDLVTEGIGDDGKGNGNIVVKADGTYTITLKAFNKVGGASMYITKA